MSRYPLKHWTGAPGEVFTADDYNRYVNIVKDMARRTGANPDRPIGYWKYIHPVSRADQFEVENIYYLEREMDSISSVYGEGTEFGFTNWHPGRIISYTDLNKIEEGLEWIDTIIPN